MCGYLESKVGCFFQKSFYFLLIHFDTWEIKLENIFALINSINYLCKLFWEWKRKINEVEDKLLFKKDLWYKAVDHYLAGKEGGWQAVTTALQGTPQAGCGSKSVPPVRGASAPESGPDHSHRQSRKLPHPPQLNTPLAPPLCHREWLLCELYVKSLSPLPYQPSL